MKLIVLLWTVFLLLPCLNVQQALAVSEEAKRYFARGISAVEMAKNPEDYEKAIQELEKAVHLAPHWADAYFNLGLVQEKAEKYRDAIESLRQYLRLAPNAADAETVKGHISKLEYKKEQSEEEAVILNSLIGRWVGGPGRNWAMYIIIKEKGGKLYLAYETTHIMTGNYNEWRKQSFNWHEVPIKRKGRNIRFTLQFRYYDRSAKKYVGGTSYADYNLELIGSGALKGTGAGSKAHFIKDDGSLGSMDADNLRRLLYEGQ